MDGNKFMKFSSPCQVEFPRFLYFEFRRRGRFFYAEQNGALNSDPRSLIGEGHVSDVFTGAELAKIKNKIAAHFASIESGRRTRSRNSR